MSIKKINGYMVTNVKFAKPKEKYICCKCGKEIPAENAYFYVDGTNYAVNKNAKPHCADCCEMGEKIEKREKEMAIISSILESKPPEERRRFMAEIIRKYIPTL